MGRAVKAAAGATMRRRAATRGRLLLTIVLLCGAVGGELAGCRPATGETITVLGSWTGAEQDGFLAMLAGFQRQYGVRVDYTGTRDAPAVLASDLREGNPPDLAVLANPGQLRQQAAAGRLAPLDGVLDQAQLANQYGPGWRALMQAVGPGGRRHYYAIVVKAALKSVIWYDPRSFPPADRATLTAPTLTLDGLGRLARGLAAAGTPPWCLGLEDTSNSGWPGTDWIEDILLQQAGPRTYDQWISGALPWTSAPVRRAWQTWGDLVGAPGLARGGAGGALLTNFGQAGQPMFASPPGCLLDHAGSFITGFYASGHTGGLGDGHPQPGRDFDFVPFPPAGTTGPAAEEVAGDLLGLFRNTPAAGRLIAYLTTPAAQAAWTRQAGGGAISVNRLVRPADYPDPVSRRLAANLTTVDAVRFDASDSMPQVLSTAFNHAVLAYLDSPGQLDLLLRGLDRVRLAST